MSSPPPHAPCKEGIRREDWDKCVRHGTWRVGTDNCFILILVEVNTHVHVMYMSMPFSTSRRATHYLYADFLKNIIN